jgi:hypothetical protein
MIESGDELYLEVFVIRREIKCRDEMKESGDER